MKYSYNKSFKIIGGFVLSALMLAACDDKETNVGDKGVEVTVSSEIVAMTGTQPSDGQWKANDAIGLFMVKAGKGIVVNMASNQKFVTPRGRRIRSCTGKGNLPDLRGEGRFPLLCPLQGPGLRFHLSDRFEGPAFRAGGSPDVCRPGA